MPRQEVFNQRKSQPKFHLIFIVIGIIFLIAMWVVEINFHYWQDFTPETVDPELFWRAEIAQVTNTFIFLGFGVGFIVYGIILYRRRKVALQRQRKRKR